MSRMSRQKGKAGERELRDVFRQEGFLKAHRGQQFSGSCESPDVVVPELPLVHIECKRTEKIDLPAWLAQVEKDKAHKLGVIFFRRNRMKDWVAIMSREDFFRLLRESSFVPATASFSSPECGQSTTTQDTKGNEQ